MRTFSPAVAARLDRYPAARRVQHNTRRFTAPGSLDIGLRYAACLKVCSSHAARASSGLRWLFFSISHSAL